MLKPFITKSTKSAAEKSAERKKAEQDPFSYKRRDPPMRNPFNHLAMLMTLQEAKKQIPSTTYRDIRETVTSNFHGIPTTKELEQMRDLKMQFRSSAESLKPQRKGYEFQILKN